MKTELDVCLGKAGTPVGKLVFVRHGPRVFTQFAYFQNWLDNKHTFNVSPDLTATPGYQTRKAAAKEDTLFFLALGDTEPDAWGRRVIARAHAKRRDITNVHDHLQNIGFLYMGGNQWQLSPAFDVNPMPDKDRESKTWLSEDTGPITSMAQLMGQASHFALTPKQALAIVRQVVQAVGQWRAVGQSADVGMTTPELDQFKLAFQHASLEEAKKWAGL
jgi:hypothetical protein